MGRWGSTVAYDLLDLVFFFSVDKVGGGAESSGCELCFHGRKIREKHRRPGGSSRFSVSRVDRQ